MKIGKISESVYDRSVKKILGKALGSATSGNIALSSYVCAYNIDNNAFYAVYGAFNELFAKGVRPTGIMVVIVMSPDEEETKLKASMHDIKQICDVFNVNVMNVRAEVSALVNHQIVEVTATGCFDEKETCNKDRYISKDIVASKWIGLEGTAIIADKKYDELKQRFSPMYIEDARAFSGYISIESEAAVAAKSCVLTAYNVSKGGIFGALWEMAELLGVGLEIDIKNIPVKQETIEISNYFDINPYELLSGGSLLMVSDNGYDLVRDLSHAGIEAAVIGKTTASNDRIVINGEEKRFLEPSKTDEIYKVL